MASIICILLLVVWVCVHLVPGNCSCDKRGYTLRCINIHLTPHLLDTIHVPPYISEVHLSNNQLSAISHQFLHRFRHVKKLAISHNRLRVIPPHAFKHFKNLTTLSLKGNLIREIHPDVFKGTKRLRSLDLSENQLSYLYHGMFKHVTGLRTLKLMANRIRVIPNGVFTRMRHLQDLFMGHNIITRMEDAAFQNMTMNKLDLTYNKIAKISPSTFLNFQIKYKIMMYFNLLECYCADVMRYAKYLTAMQAHIWANCHLPRELKDKNILTAFTFTKCTLCDLDVCKNGGRCRGNQTDFTCTCSEQFKGKTCDRSICEPDIVRYVDDVVKFPSVKQLKYSDKRKQPKHFTHTDLVYLAVKNKELETKLMILYAICSIELVIILCFVGLLIVGKYQDWRLVKKYKQEKRHTLTRFKTHTTADQGGGSKGYTPTALGDRGKGYTSISQIIPAYKYDCTVR